MNKKPPVKQTIDLVIPGVVSATLLATPVKSGARPTPVKPVKQPVVSPPVVPAPVPQRLELPANCDNFLTNQFVAHGGAIVSIFNGPVKLQDITYGRGLVSIIPQVGNWVEQISNDGGKTYKATGVSRNQLQAGANPTTTINLTLDGGVGPAKLMRYLLNQESL